MDRGSEVDEEGNSLRKSLSTSSLRKRANTAPQPAPTGAAPATTSSHLSPAPAGQTKAGRKISNAHPPTSAGITPSNGNFKPLSSPLNLHIPKEKLRSRLSISALPPSAGPPPTSAHAKSLSLWDYLVMELSSPGDALFTEEKTEQLVNVIKVPLYLERVIAFGVFACLDSFLYTFTILPLRFVYSLYKMLKLGGRSLSPSRRGDVVKGVIFFLVLSVLLRIDTSKIYHGIRGQAAIKLYVMFNVLEIADKLCSALGQDVMECLYSSNTLNRPKRFFGFAALAIAYCVVHSFVLLYQIITLNVAVNSYSNALLTLLLSNQFSEVKSAVFKKFERENLFQLTCADITERFQLLIMLSAIGIRNVVEVSSIGIVPMSWAGWNRWMGALVGPVFVVVGSEVLVDWLKHAYVTKFNNIRPRVYRKFLDVIAIDYSENAFSDQIMTKRIGLPIYPLAAVFVRMLIQSYTIFAETAASVSATSASAMSMSRAAPAASPVLTNAASPSARSALEKVDEFLKNNVAPSYFSLNFTLISISSFAVLLVFKLLLGLFLYKYSSKRHGSAVRQRRHRKAEEPSDFVSGRDRGFGTVELDEKMRHRLYEPEEETPELRERKQSAAGLMEYWGVTRFKMVAKRIW